VARRTRRASRRPLLMRSPSGAAEGQAGGSSYAGAASPALPAILVEEYMQLMVYAGLELDRGFRPAHTSLDDILREMWEPRAFHSRCSERGDHQRQRVYGLCQRPLSRSGAF